MQVNGTSSLMTSESRFHRERAYTHVKKTPVKYFEVVLEKDPPKNYRPQYMLHHVHEEDVSPKEGDSIKQTLRKMMRHNISKKQTACSCCTSLFCKNAASEVFIKR